MIDGATGGDGAAAAELLTGDAGAGAGALRDGAGAPPQGDREGEAAAAAGADDGAADPDWYGSLSVETIEGETASNRDWIKAKGFKDLDGVTKALRSAEKAIHDKGMVKLPGEGASAEEIAAWRTAIGVPESADGYTIAPVKGADGEDVALDTPLLARLAAKAHEAGVPKAAYEGLVNEFVAAQLEDFNGMEAEQRAEGKQWADGQGDKAPAKLAAVNRGQQVLGISGEEVASLRNAIGAARTLELLSGLGDKVGEDVLIGGSGGQQFMANGDQAQAEIDRMRGDSAMVAKMTVKGTPENAKYNRLLAIAGEAANRRQAAGL